MSELNEVFVWLLLKWMWFFFFDFLYGIHFGLIQQQKKMNNLLVIGELYLNIDFNENWDAIYFTNNTGRDYKLN